METLKKSLLLLIILTASLINTDCSGQKSNAGDKSNLESGDEKVYGYFY